jgi:hypothetical protein
LAPPSSRSSGDSKGRRLAALRQPDRLVGVEQPRMEKVDVARFSLERVLSSGRPAASSSAVKRAML